MRVAELLTVAGSNKLGRTIERDIEHLSSGYRIARAADDAAGMGVSLSLEAEARCSIVAQRGVEEANNLLAVAEGAMGELSDILVRMRELAMQSASEILSQKERDYLQDEYAILHAEIDRVSGITKYGDIALLDGTWSSAGVGPLSVLLDQNGTSFLDCELGSMDNLALGLGRATATLSTAGAGITGVSAPSLATDTGTITVSASAVAATAARIAAATVLQDEVEHGGTLLLGINGGATSISLNGASAATLSGSSPAANSLSGGNLDITIDGHSYTLSVTAGSSPATVVSDLNSLFGGEGTASLDGSGVLSVVTESVGSTSSLEILGSSSAGLLADLGLSAGLVQGGAGDSPAQVMAAVNTAIAGQGLAVLAVSTAIRITSNLSGPTGDVQLGTGSTAGLVAELGLEERADGVYGNRQNRTNLLVGGTLDLVVNGSNVSVSLNGTTAATLTGTNTLSGSIGSAGSLNVDVNGSSFSIAVSASDTGSSIVTALNAQLGSTGIASLSGGALRIASRTTGATTSVSILGSSSGSVLAALGYSSGQSSNGLDGETAGQVAAAIQAAIGGGATASASTSQRLGIVSTVVGSSSELRILAGSDSNLVTEMGFTLSSQSVGTDQELQVTATHSNGDSSSVLIAPDAEKIRFTGDLEGLILDKDPTVSTAADLTATISYDEGGLSNVRSVQDALDALGEVDGALQILTQQRTRVGSYSRRLDHALANLEQGGESLHAALSRLRDADIAAVVAELNQHLTGRNAVVSMLAATGRISRTVMETILSLK